MNHYCIFSELLYFCHMNYSHHLYQYDADIVKTELNEFWLCRLLQGSATMLFEQSEYELKKGTVFVVPEGIRFKLLSATPDMELETIVFQVQIMNVVYSLLGSEADFGTLDVAFWCDKRLKKPFSRLLALDYESLRTAVLQPDLIARNKMITSGLVHLLLTLYNSAENRPEAASVGNGKRSRLILNHFYELADAHVPLGERSIAFYADQLCISSRYLFKVCKAETGKTPKELIHQFLIGAIKNALLTSELSNQQIADRLGFPDQSAFGQFFKRQEGISPSEFRKRYR